MWFDYTIYTLLFLIPAHLVRFEVFGVPTNLWEVMFAAVFLAWLVSSSEWRRKLRGFTILSLGILLLFLGLALGTLMSPELRASIGALKGWFVEPLLFAFLIHTKLTYPIQQKKALAALAASGVFVALAAIVYWLIGDLTFDKRVRAFYESPNMLAMYIAPALIIFALELSAKGKRQKAKPRRTAKISYKAVSLYTGAFLLLVALLLTRSAGAMVALFATLFVWWSWGKFWGKPWGKRAGMLLCGIALLLPLASLLIDPWVLRPSSLASRLMIWKSALFIARDHLLLGRGLGTFQHDYLAYQAQFPPYLEWAVPHPHSIILGTLLAGGVLGLTGMMLILFNIFKKFQEQFPLQSAATSAAFFIMLYLLLHGIIDNTLWRGDMALLWASVLALTWISYPERA